MKLIDHRADADASTVEGFAGAASFAAPGVRTAARRVAAFVLVFLCGVQSGCYANIPIASQPVPGSTIVLTLNDNGRAALGPNIGAAVETVEGTLDSHSDSAYVLRVTGISYMNGQTNKWTNEPLTIANQYVGGAQERRLSRSRTALAAGIAVGSVVLFAATRGLLGFGDPGKDPGGNGGEGQ